MIHLEVISFKNKIFEGEVEGVQLPGVDGYFEILTKHAPLVSALQKGKMTILKNISSKDKMEIDINGGFAEVFQNKISVICS